MTVHVYVFEMTVHVYADKRKFGGGDLLWKNRH